MKKVLLVTSSYDLTADYFIDKYQDVEFFRFNTDLFPEYQVRVCKAGFEIVAPTWRCQSDTLSALYYRKPAMPNYKEVIDQEYLPFVSREVLALIEGLVDSFRGVCLLRPHQIKYAGNKVVQLHKAAEVGFSIPAALITNSWSGNEIQGRTVVKPLASGEVVANNEKRVFQTNLVDKGASTDALMFCPAYFQTYVEKDYDVRVTVVGRHYFAAKILSPNKVDWRQDPQDLAYERMELPPDLERKCEHLMRQLGIVFGCFDFVVKGGQFEFLEVNVNGQWLWLELALGFGISDAIMQMLLNAGISNACQDS